MIEKASRRIGLGLQYGAGLNAALSVMIIINSLFT